jgi:hypothetical protein
MPVDAPEPPQATHPRSWAPAAGPAGRRRARAACLLSLALLVAHPVGPDRGAAIPTGALAPASVTVPDTPAGVVSGPPTTGTAGSAITEVGAAPGTVEAGPPVAGPAAAGSGLAAPPAGGAGIPGAALRAYLGAERALAQADPGCGVSWALLAGIGHVESGHARGGRVDATGTTLSPILGPRLSGGPGMATIVDTDRGRLDGDPTWDRAVGPMQFIPSTWSAFAADGTGDRVANPHNLHDAALTAARYLCAGGADLRVPGGAAAAVLRYNRSAAYVRTVLALAARYAGGVAVLPDALGVPGVRPAQPVAPLAAAVAPVPADVLPAAPAPPAPGAVAPAPGAPAPLPIAPAAPTPLTPAPAVPPSSLPAPGSPPPVTSAPVTSPPVTSAPVTSAPVTSAPATSAPVTSAPATSAPVTNSASTATGGGAAPSAAPAAEPAPSGGATPTSACPGPAPTQPAPTPDPGTC